MKIHQIIPANEGWRAVFYRDGQLDIRPVIVWGLVSQDREDQEDRFIDGFTLEHGEHELCSISEVKEWGDQIFLGYLSPGETVNEAALLKEGKEIENRRFKGLSPSDQVKALEALMKVKGYSTQKLHKPVDKFSDAERQKFYEHLVAMPDAKTEAQRT